MKVQTSPISSGPQWEEGDSTTPMQTGWLLLDSSGNNPVLEGGCFEPL